MHKIGDTVRVDYHHSKKYHGKIGVIVEICECTVKGFAIGYPPQGQKYVGCVLSPKMVGQHGGPICWLPEHLKKIDPPDFNVPLEEEAYDRA